MRRARPILAALLLLLALAPTASAHGDDEPDHRDTPADLRGADITRTLAIAHLTSTTSPNLAQFAPTTWCGSRLTADDSESTPPSRRRSGRSRSCTPTPAASRTDRRSGATRCRPTSRTSSSTSPCRRAAPARCASTWAPSAGRSTSTSRWSRSRRRASTTATTDHFSRLAHDVAAAVGSLTARATSSSWPTGSPTTRCRGIAEVIDDDSAGAGNESNTGGLTAIMWTTPRPSPIRRIAGSRR